MADEHAANNAKGEKANAQGPLTAQEFAGLVTGMSRFLGQLSSCGPFQEADIGIGEWSLLNHLSQGPVEQRKLTRDLGVTKQRVNQICDSLKKSGTIEITPAPDDPRMNSVAITAAGKARVEGINAKLIPSLTKDDGDGKKLRALHSASRSVRILRHIFAERAHDAKIAAQQSANAKA